MPTLSEQLQQAARALSIAGVPATDADESPYARWSSDESYPLALLV